MRAVRLGWLNARRMAGRSFATVVTMVVCGTVCLLGATVASAAQVRAEEKLESGSGLRQIDVESFDDEVSAKKLTDARIAEIGRMSGVKSVEPKLEASINSAADSGLAILLHATNARPSVLPPLTARSRDTVFPLKAGEVVLPASTQGTDLSPYLGKDLVLEYSVLKGKNEGAPAKEQVRVVGLFDPTWQEDGPDSAYAADDLVLKWSAAGTGMEPARFLASYGYLSATVVADSDASVDPIVAELQHQGFVAKSVRDRVRELPGILLLFKVLSQALLVLLVIVGFLAGLGLGNTVMRQRMREVGLLRAVGYARSEVRSAFAVEVACVGLVTGLATVLIGGLVGVVTARALSAVELFTDLLPRSFVAPPLLPLAVILLVPVFAISIGASRPLRRAANVDPVAALQES
jgi:putative ABC transport system permease protein